MDPDEMMARMSPEERAMFFFQMMQAQRMMDFGEQEPDTAMECPVCKVRHEEQDASGPQELSHGARRVFTSDLCPICLEDKAGPPMVVFPCGHLVCEADFEELGGSLNPERPSTESNNSNNNSSHRVSPEQRSSSNTSGRGNSNEDYFNRAHMQDFMNFLMQSRMYGDDDDDDEEEDDDYSDMEDSDSDDDLPPLEDPDGNYVEEDDDEDEMPPLEHPNGELVEEEDDDDEMPPLEHSDGEPVEEEEDDDDDDDLSSVLSSVPPLLGGLVDSSSEDESGVPALAPRPRPGVDSSDDEIPPLAGGTRGRCVDSSDDSSDDDVPYLQPRRNGVGAESDSDDDDDVPNLATRDGDHNSSDSDTSDDDEEDSPPRRRRRRRRRASRRNQNDSSDEESIPSLGGFVQGRDSSVGESDDGGSGLGSDRYDSDDDSSDGPMPPLTNRGPAGRTNPPQEVESQSSNDEMSEDQAGTIISDFVSSCHKRNIALKRKQEMLSLIKCLQATWRGHSTRKKHSDIVTRLQDARVFRKRWGDVLSVATNEDVLTGINSWESLKRNQFNMARVLEDADGEDETFDLLDSAAAAAITIGEEETGAEDDFEDAREEEEDIVEAVESMTLEDQREHSEFLSRMEGIKLTGQVLKWLERADSKFRGLFIRRIEQLASGQRSRILAKHLTGCQTTINETYLEQKSGHRIVWTPCVDNGQSSILIWYVAKHKHVSRYLGLIDEAEKRSKRGLVSAAKLYDENDAMTLEPNAILLDPLADTPLKLHHVRRDEVSRLKFESWTPPLRLTADERRCVEKDGTVLLLGRSGTGKTICICNRMDFDRKILKEDVSLNQLFVARSRRICDYVKQIVETNTDRHDSSASSKRATYLTFKDFVQKCDEALGADDADVSTLSSHKVDFHRYKDEFYSDQRDALLDPLVVWTQIRSFIKGSIDAVQKGRPLEEEEYMALGKNRCILSPNQRRVAYAAFEAYEQNLQSECLWDDCDMAAKVLRKFNRASPDLLHEIMYDRLYVDEVQDYTQAELALFYRCCGQGRLFFAGDTAQSVVEGVTFRFQDLRMVAHALYEGDQRYIPDKPVTVNVNFRSHTGVLDVAAAILERIFTVFPSGTNKLPPDEGIYVGPRPGVFNNLDMNMLKSMLKRNEGVVVLTHDEHVTPLRTHLGNEHTVIGIRDAKGMEFPDVMIVDFFSGLPVEHHKPWKNMLLKKDIANLKPGFPELESQLKLLYTAITRCSKRLFFVETKNTDGGQAFIRWLTMKRDPKEDDTKDTKRVLASVQDSTKVEKVLTPDEWRSSGVDYAVYAETHDSPESAFEWLERASHCFDRVADGALLRKVQTHRSSLDLLLSFSEQSSDQLSPEQELEVARVSLACAKEGMLPEMFRLVTAVLPKLGSCAQEKLQKDFLPKIERVVD